MAPDDHARGATLRGGTGIRAAWEGFLELARCTVEVPADLAQRITRQIHRLAHDEEIS